MRKRNLSVPDIKARLDAATEEAPSERTIDRVLKQEGFARLPRRTQAERQAQAPVRLEAPVPALLDPLHSERFPCVGYHTIS